MRQVDLTTALMEKTVQSCDSPLSVPSLLNHLIRPLKHANWNCQTDLLCRLEVNDEFKTSLPAAPAIGRFGSLQDLVHANSRDPIAVNGVRPVGHDPTSIYRYSAAVR